MLELVRRHGKLKPRIPLAPPQVNVTVKRDRLASVPTLALVTVQLRFEFEYVGDSTRRILRTCNDPLTTR